MGRYVKTERTRRERIYMSAFEMQITGYVLIGTGLVFFLATQLLLGRWLQAYEAEQGGMRQ